MTSKWHYFAILCFISYFYVIGTLIFARGFLLTRQVITAKSVVADDEIPAKFSKAILLIIDALKYEFTTCDNSTEDTPFHNKLCTITELVQSRPQHAKLYRFVADPPTTTMQRLKALTTGSLPTFVDASANFATYKVDEDNLVDQLWQHGKRVVFMGDDTWIGLYPEKFAAAYPYPSFNVWDLDTVDRGIREHLLPQMKTEDWDVIIAHFLGVDHCGHRYGPHNSEMGRKLSEMNDVIKSVVQNMDNDTVLLVFGDHGMTKTGDHGGDSIDEISSALFAYSLNVPLMPYESLDSESVYQIDIVPTVSVLLGTSIPFSSLGSVMLDLVLPNCTNWMDYGKKILLNNAAQVHTYITEYAKYVGQFRKDDLSEIDYKFAQLSRQAKSFPEFVHEAIEFFQTVKQMAASVWVQFNTAYIALGISTIIATNLLSVVLATHAVEVNIKAILCLLASIICLLPFTSEFIVGTLTLLVILGMLWQLARGIKLKPLVNIPVIILTLVPCASLFSNSYVVEEGSVLSFLIVTAVSVYVWGLKPSDKMRISSRKLRTLVALLVFIITIRASHAFWRCREEQACEEEKTVRSYTTYFLTVVSLAFFVTVERMWWRSCGNMNGFSLSVLVARYFCPVVVVLMLVYWALQGFVTQTLPWNLYSFAQVVVATIAISIIAVVAHPLAIYLLPNSTACNGDVPSVFAYLKETWNKPSSKGNGPVVYGLATVFSAAFLIAIVLFTLLLAMLLGDVLAVAVVLAVVSLSVFLQIVTWVRMENISCWGDIFDIPWAVVACWSLLASYFFYGTGHQPTFPTIPWEAAFVGHSGNFTSHILPAAAVLTNLYSSQLLYGFSLPLLLIAPLTIQVMYPAVGFIWDGFGRDVRKGEVLLWEKENEWGKGLFQLSTKYFCIGGTKLLFAMFAATLHCRHLMVWKIFAPHFIFEAVAMFSTLLAVLLGLLFAYRITAALRHFLNQVGNRKT